MKDDENINSQPFMHWRDRFLTCMEAVNPPGRNRRGEGTLPQHNRRDDGRDVPGAPNLPAILARSSSWST